MAFLTLADVEVEGKGVFVRCDFNVPLSEDGQVADETRIRATLPTLKRLQERGARALLASHLGRPKGKPNPSLSLRPVAKRLGEILGKEVPFVADCVGPEVKSAAAALQEGGFLLLENLRFHPGEEKNDREFAQALAGPCELYVNDAFASSHRAHASVAAIAEFLQPAVAGLLLEKELQTLSQVMDSPGRPMVAICGGAKVSDKLNLINKLLDQVDKILVGGAMAFTFLRAQGLEVGASRVEQGLTEEASQILKKAKKAGVAFLLPVDLVVAEQCSPEAQTRIVSAEEIPPGWMGLDIGPRTLSLFGKALKDAQTIVWNGPMGVFEMKPFSRGTFEVLEQVVTSGARTVVGGGDTDVVVHQAGVAQKISFISTGGGAFLEFLEGRALPGVAALTRRPSAHG